MPTDVIRSQLNPLKTLTIYFSSAYFNMLYCVLFSNQRLGCPNCTLLWCFAIHTIRRRKAKWIDYILRRNCLLKQGIEGKLEGRIEMTGRRGRRRKQPLDDLKEKSRYWKLKEEALDRTVWRTRLGRGYGPVVRQTTEWRDYGPVVRQTAEWLWWW
jgi:hypothetical protein